MRAQQTRGTQGRPETTATVAGESATETRIKAIFKTQYRMLAALFPKDGDTMVNRACSAACFAAREVITTGEHKGQLKLGKATAEAIAEKVIACHHLGLEIGDQAYLVPYGDDVQLIIGPRGLVTLMMNSGFVKSIVARSVFEADVAAGLFSYDLGSKPFIRHQKAPAGRRDEKTSNIVYAYAIIETTTEGQIIEVLTWEDLEYYRSFSKAGKGGAWDKAFEGMCRKTAIKRIAEFVPRSAMLSAALREDDRGGYEIPEELMQAVRGKIDGSAKMTIPNEEEIQQELTEVRAAPGNEYP